MGAFDRISSSADRPRTGPVDRPYPTPVDRPLVESRTSLLADIQDVADQIPDGGELSVVLSSGDSGSLGPGALSATLTRTDSGFRLRVDEQYNKLTLLHDAGRSYVVREDGRAEVNVFGTAWSPYRSVLRRAGVPEEAMNFFHMRCEMTAATDVPTRVLAVLRQVAHGMSDSRPSYVDSYALRDGLDTDLDYRVTVNGRDLADWIGDREPRPGGGDTVRGAQYDWELSFPKELVRAVRTNNMSGLRTSMAVLVLDIDRRFP